MIIVRYERDNFSYIFLIIKNKSSEMPYFQGL